MHDLLVALGLVFFLEGLALAVFGKSYPEAMRRLGSLSPPILRALGLAIAFSGLLWVWMLRS